MWWFLFPSHLCGPCLAVSFWPWNCWPGCRLRWPTLAGPELVFEFANEQFRLLVGGRDVAGLPVGEALPEVAGQGCFKMLDRVMASGEPVHAHEAEVWVRHAGEQVERVFLDFVYQPVRDGGGCAAGVLVHATDVSAHVRARRELEALSTDLAATQERYRALFETLPQGVVHHAADGAVLGANPAASQILGLDCEALPIHQLQAPSWQAVSEDGSPLRPEELPVKVALATGEVVADAVVGVRHGKTGERRWLNMTAVPDARDDSGRPQRVSTMFTDLTGQRRTEAALQESNSFLGRLRDANVLGIVLGDEQRIYDANGAFLDMVGYSRADLEAGLIDWRAITPPEWASSDDDALEQLRETGTCRPFEKQMVHRDGYRVPLLMGAAVIDRDPLRWVTFVVDLTARQQAEQERARLLARERAARAEAASAQERLSLLLRAGALAAAAGDQQELAQQAARLMVPALADFCAVFLPDANGTLTAATLVHRGPDGTPVLSDLAEDPLPPAGPLIIGPVYASGASTIVHDLAAELRHQTSQAPALSAIAARFQTDSLLTVPLIAHGQPIGVLTFGRSAGREAFGDSDITVVEELGRRLAIGLAHADTFAREHTIAETLQRALLPDRLPHMPGLDLAVRYLPATEGADVGGDWYDAFPIDATRVGLVIGDVAGHTIASASMMGRIRNILRAYAIDRPDPADVLQRTNTALLLALPDALATAAVAVLDIGTGDLTYASAGHPPPRLAAGHGRAEYLEDVTGAMLGAFPDIKFTASHRRLAAGTRLLFYTDGLVEDRHRALPDGLKALAATLQACGPGTAEQTCATVQATLLGTASRADDVCLLAARLT